MLNIFSKKKKQEQPNYEKVISDLQRATKESFGAYEQVNTKLRDVERLYEDKMKDLRLFKGLSSISLELLSSNDFEKSVTSCLKILAEATKYDHCVLYLNDQDNTYSDVLFEYFNQTAMEDTVLSRLDFNKYPNWATKLKRREVICEEGGVLLNKDFKDHGFEQICISPIFVGDKWWGCLLLSSFKKICAAPNETEAIITVSNMFSESIRRHNLLKETSCVQNRFHDFSSYLLNNVHGIAFWMKDYQDRYLFLNDNLLSILFPGKTKDQCIGKTDSEIIAGVEPFELTFDNIFDPKDLVDLDLSGVDYDRICNLTDQITRHLGYPCKYFELVDNHAFEVWKSPMFRNSFKGTQFCCAGTVGALKDVSDQKEQKLKYVKELQHKKTSFPINGTNNYYIITEDAPTIFFE